MRRILYFTFLAVIFSSCERVISEFQTQNFIKYYGGSLITNGYDVKEINDGYIMTGFDNTSQLKKQIYIIRTDKAGNAKWQRRFGTSLNEEGRVVKTYSDFFYVAGTTTHDNGIVSSFLLKVNQQGDSIGFTIFGAENNDYSLIIHDFIIDSESIYIAGETYQNSSTQSDYYVAKYTLNGDLVWPRPFNFNGSQQLQKIFVKQNGRILAVGQGNGVSGSSFTHISMVELSTGGVPVDSKNLEASGNQLFEDALMVGDELIVVYNQLVQGAYAGRIAKINTNDFSVVWHIQTGLPVRLKSIAQSTGGVYTLCGELNSKIYIFQIDDTGTITLAGNESDILKALSGTVESIISTSDDGFAFIGTTAPEYGTMLQLVKTDSELFLFQP